MLTALTGVAGAERVQRLRRALAVVALAAVVEAACFALLVPLLTALLDRRFPESLWWAAAFAVAGAAAFTADRLSMSALRAETTHVISGLHQRVGDHVATLPLGWFRPANQDRLSRLLTTGATSLAIVLSAVIAINVRAAALGVAIVVVAAFVDPAVAVVCGVGLAVLGGLHALAGAILRGANTETTEVSQRIAAELVEFAQKQTVLRAYGRLDEADSDLHRAIVDARRAARRYFLRAIVGATAFALGSALLLSAAMLTVVVRAEAGTLAPALGVVLVLFAALLVDAVAALGRTASIIWSAQADVEAMADVLATSPLPEPEVSAPVADAAIEFHDVTFGYSPDTPVLDGISFAVPSGGVCALVGPSGSGKTTLVRLAARFFDVDAGSVTIGGADVRDVRAVDLNRQLAVVFQDVYLFDGTIRENVVMGHAHVSDGRLTDIARRSRLDEVIERLPQGWETPVGDRGTALSGGERQRVSIARALFKDAPLVLLDEATSALDVENEHSVRAAFDELGAGRTRLIVAHRLSTVRDADVIVFLEGGRATEVGSHGDLLARGGRYASFWSEQETVRSGGGAGFPS